MKTFITILIIAVLVFFGYIFFRDTSTSIIEKPESYSNKDENVDGGLTPIEQFCILYPDQCLKG